MIFGKIYRHTWKKQCKREPTNSSVLREVTYDNDTSSVSPNKTFSVSVLPDKKFDMCLNFYKTEEFQTYRNKTFESELNYTYCRIVDPTTRRYLDQDICKLDYILENNTFKVTLQTDKIPIVNSDGLERYGIHGGDIAGMIRCTLAKGRIEEDLFDIPFVKRNDGEGRDFWQSVLGVGSVKQSNDGGPQKANDGDPHIAIVVGSSTSSAVLVIVGIGIFCWNYQRRKKRLAGAYAKVWR